MHNINSLICTISIVFITTLTLTSQVPTIQDCLGAIPICQTVYTESQSPSGDGNYVDELNPDFTCLAFESNAIWYTFTTNASGNFGFLVTPNNITDDFDWALYNITGKDCSAIRTDETVLVSCNAAGGGSCNRETGATGGTIYDLQGGGCFTNPPTIFSGFDPENDLVAVQANSTYVLMISNWTGSSFGYTIDFGISDVDIFDTRKPRLLSDNFPNGCSSSEINLTFDENILCSSVLSSNFSLIGPDGAHNISVSSELCTNGSQYDRIFDLLADPPITVSGMYTLSFCCMEDACGNIIDPVVLNYNVNIVAAPEVELGPDITLCVGESITLDATNESADYDWSNNLETATIDVSTTGLYGVTVSNGCGTTSDAINILFIDAPNFDFAETANLCTGQSLTLDASADEANYDWSTGEMSPAITVNAPGTYSVTTMNQCGTLTDEIDVNFTDTPQVDLGPDQDICQGETIQLMVNFPGADINWQDNSNGTSIDVNTTGTYAVTVTNSCGTATDDVIISVLEIPDFDLGPEQFVCEGDLVTLTASGTNASFNWSSGETTPSITVTNSGLYSVQVENACGMVTDEVQINFSPNFDIAFDPMFYLCEPLTLTAVEDYTFAEYTWSNGSTQQSLEVLQPGEYWLELSSGCKVIRDTIQVLECEECEVYFPNIFSPNNDGMNDEFTIASPCTFDKYELLVFDRWGNQIFSSSDINNAWDGRKDGNSLTPGVYSYYLDYEWTVNGINEQKKKTGTITLLSN